MAPFLVTFVLFFLYPLYRVVQMSFTDAPLLGGGDWVGLRELPEAPLGQAVLHRDRQQRLLRAADGDPDDDRSRSLIALMVNRLKGRLQAFVLVIFFLPYVLPVSVVTEIWNWMLDFQYGVLQPVIAFFTGKPVAVFRNPYWVMPVIAAVTIWWTNGFNVLLFIAGLRNIPSELYEAAALDGATPRQRFWRVTWPLLWPVTALVLTLQLILQLKIFDQVYLLSAGGPFNSSYVLLLQLYREAFQLNHGGYGSAIAIVLVVIIAVISVLQYQVLRIRGTK